MGFKPGVTRDQIAAAIAKFGKSDEIYDLMKSYTVYENETWMVRPGFVHAPGPKVTIEIQLAQDDFNFLGYQLGQRLDDDEVEKTVQELHLRGLKDTNDFLTQCVDWNMNIGNCGEIVFVLLYLYVRIRSRCGQNVATQKDESI